MSDDWQKGDTALCIRRDGGGWLSIPWIEVGTMLEVAEVDELFDGSSGLGFVGFPIERRDIRVTAYDADRFVKIRPHQPDEEDAETIRLLTGKPAKVEV